MGAPPSPMRLDDRVKAEDSLYASMFHPEDRGYLAWGLAVAIVLHVVCLFVPVPEHDAAPEPRKDGRVVVVRKYVPPPPRIERAPSVERRLARRVPVPDPEPDEPEPIREPAPEELEPQALPPDAEFIIGDPEPPPSPGPMLPGVGGVTHPARIAESYVDPVYPEHARRAKIAGKVFLQVIVERDGSVGEVSLLRCNRPGLGFEDAAIAAVRQWRYEAATQDGEAVDAVITVIVEFVLQ